MFEVCDSLTAIEHVFGASAEIIRVGREVYEMIIRSRVLKAVSFPLFDGSSGFTTSVVPKSAELD